MVKEDKEYVVVGEEKGKKGEECEEKGRSGEEVEGER